MKHDAPQFFPDDYSIGQRRVAENRAEIALASMKHEAQDAFCVGYVNPDWRAMKRRLFYSAQAEYERAKAVLAFLDQQEEAA